MIKWLDNKLRSSFERATETVRPVTDFCQYHTRLISAAFGTYSHLEDKRYHAVKSACFLGLFVVSAATFNIEAFTGAGFAVADEIRTLEKAGLEAMKHIPR